MLKRLVTEELFLIGRLYRYWKCKLDGLIFEVNNLSTQILDHPNLNFLVRKELGKFNTFYTLIYARMIKMIWDTIVMDGGVWRLKKLWTFKGWTFTVKRDPEKHTMRKLNAYWFNADCLNMIYKANPDAKILLRLHVNPPYWWMKDNMEETVSTTKQQNAEQADAHLWVCVRDVPQGRNRHIPLQQRSGERRARWHPWRTSEL